MGSFLRKKAPLQTQWGLMPSLVLSAAAAAAAAEERKLLGTRRQFGRRTAPEQKRLEAARRTLRQDGWSIGR